MNATEVDPRLETPALTTLCRSFALLGAEGAAVGLGLWSLRVGDAFSAYVAGNVLTTAQRTFVMADLFGGAAVAMLVGALILARRRSAGVETVRRLAFRLSPLILVWLAPLLFNWRLWKDRELQFLALAGLLGVGLQRLVRVSLLTPSVFPRLPAPSFVRSAGRRIASAFDGVLPTVLVVMGALGYAAFFSFFTIRNHYRLGTAAMDLGLEDNLIYNAVHWGPLFKSSPLGGPTSSHGGFHQTYFAYLIAIPYRFAPTPRTLLVIQAFLMGAAAVPLYFFARRKLSRAVACLIAFLYLIYAPLHGANLYDFHYLPLATVFLWTTLNLVEGRRYWWASFVVLVTLSIREDVSALLVIIGGYLLFTGDRPLPGLVLALVSTAYFIALKMFIMPRFMGGTESFIHQYSGFLPAGEKGYGGVLKTVFANPAFSLGLILEKNKLIYLLQIIIPFAFLPWRRPIGLLCTVPGFLFTLLATNYPPLIQTSFQYTTYWTTFLFLAVVANLSWMKERELAGDASSVEFGASRKAWLVALVAAMVVTSYQFGGLFQQHTVRGGFGAYRFDLTQADRDRHERLYQLIREVPPDARIVSSELIVPHVSERPNAYTLRVGIFDAEYLLIWMPPWGDERRAVVDAIKGGKFGVVDERGEFVLAKRGYSTAKNAAVVAKYRL